MPASSAAAIIRVLSNIRALPASSDSSVAPARAITWMVGMPTTGTSKRMSWLGLATLTTTTPGAGQVGGPAR